MLENVNHIVKLAKESNTSVIAFICMDHIMSRAVIEAAASTNTPALVMLYPEHASIQKTCTKAGFFQDVKSQAEQVSVPIGLHMDHDFSYEGILHTYQSGFRSMMFDGSMQDLETNIALTKQVVSAFHPLGAVIEGEIGHVGLASDHAHETEDLFTKPEAAARFCKETQVDLLAVSIGNAHGEYKSPPCLDLKRLEEIQAAVSTPLVLHGGSGIPDKQLLQAFSRGIRKFNLGTEFLGKYHQALEEYAAEYSANPDPVKVIHMPDYVVDKLLPYVKNRLQVLCHF